MDIQKSAARLLDLIAQRDELEEAIKNLREAIGEAAGDGETLAGDFKITRYPNKRFDDGLARKVLTPEQYDSISVQKADSKKAAALLDEADLEKCKKTFSSVTKVGLRND